jgi:hypothetical protein
MLADDQRARERRRGRGAALSGQSSSVERCSPDDGGEARARVPSEHAGGGQQRGDDGALLGAASGPLAAGDRVMHDAVAEVVVMQADEPLVRYPAASLDLAEDSGRSAGAAPR